MVCSTWNNCCSALKKERAHKKREPATKKRKREKSLKENEEGAKYIYIYQ